MFNDTNEVLERFNDEINAIITNVNNSRSNILLLGDFNINILKSNAKSSVNNYLGSLLANYLLPVISFSTRFTDYSCSLIGNIFTNISTDYLSSRTSDISDHLITDNTANPNYNYHILETILVDSINKIMPLRKFKFHCQDQGLFN